MKASQLLKLFSTEKKPSSDLLRAGKQGHALIVLLLLLLLLVLLLLPHLLLSFIVFFASVLNHFFKLHLNRTPRSPVRVGRRGDSQVLVKEVDL